MTRSGQRRIEMGGRSSRFDLETNTFLLRFAITCFAIKLVHC